MIGRRWNVPLGVLLSVNANTGMNLPFALLTTSAIAIAVALATGLEMTSRAVIADLDRTASAIAGKAEIEVVAGNVGVPESLLRIVEETPGVRVASPLLEGTFRLVDGGTAIRVLGLDLAAEEDARGVSVERAGVTIRDPLRILVRPESVIVAAALARQMEVDLGDSLPVLYHGRKMALTIEGILGEGGVGDAYGGQIAVMDVYSLQELTGREGWLDRIDVTRAQGSDIEEVIARIEARVAGKATVRRASLKESIMGATARMIRQATFLLSSFGTIVAALLAFAAVSLAIARRDREWLLLRSIGGSSSMIRRLVWLDCATYAAIGSFVGVVLGIGVSRVLASVAGALPGMLGASGIARSDLAVAPITLWIALGVGIATSVAAAVLAGTRASRTAEMFDAPRQTRTRRAVRQSLWSLVAALWVLMSFASGLPGLLRAILQLVLAMALVLGSARYLGVLIALCRPALELIFRGFGHLVGTAFIARPSSVALTVGCVSAVSIMVSTTLTLASSIEESLLAYANMELSRAIRVTGGTPFAPVDRDPVSTESIARMQASPFVEGIAPIVSRMIIVRGTEVDLLATSGAGMDDWPSIGTGRCESSRLTAGAIGVSDAFQRYFGVEVGESLTLDTPLGERDFRVACLYRSFEGPAGSVLMDLSAYDSLWQRDGADSVLVWPKGRGTDLVRDLQEQTRGGQELFFVDGASARLHVRRIVDRFSIAFQTIALLGLTLGGLAVANCMTGIAIERRREFEILKTTGATRGHLAGLVLFDGALLGLPATVLGIVLGIVVSAPLREVFRDSFGWSLQPAVDLYSLAIFVGATVLAIAGAGMYPAWQARRVTSRDAFAPE